MLILESISITPVAFGAKAVRRGVMPIGILYPMAGASWKSADERAHPSEPITSGLWYGVTIKGPTEASSDIRALIKKMEALLGIETMEM